MENPLADIVETQISMQRQYRIPFEDLCGFYAAIVWRVPLPAVAVASTLTLPSIYHLKAAGTFRAGQFRYRRVAAEFARLGKEAFSTKYLTAPIKDRLRVAQAQVKQNRIPVKPHLGVNPRASKFAGVHTLKDPLGGPDKKFAVEFSRVARIGWVWRDLNPTPPGEIDQSQILRGDPRCQERRFAKSGDAFDFCRLRFTPTREQILDGDNEKALDDTWINELPNAGITT